MVIFHYMKNRKDYGVVIRCVQAKAHAGKAALGNTFRLCTAKIHYRKFETNIHRKGIAGP
jgi:hypothetical protein